MTSECLPRHSAVAYLFVVKPMRAVSIYRALLLVRVGWLLLEWFLGWDSRRHVNSFTLLHPYAALFAMLPSNSPGSSFLQVCGIFVAGRVCYLFWLSRSQSLTAPFGLIAVYRCRRHLSSRSVGVLSC